MTKRIILNLNGSQHEALENIRKDMLQTSLSAVIFFLIKEKNAEIQNNTTYKGVGRPPKGYKGADERDTSVDDIPIYPHPDQLANKGRMLTLDELKGWYSLKGREIPEDIYEPGDVRAYAARIEEELYPNSPSPYRNANEG